MTDRLKKLREAAKASGDQAAFDNYFIGALVSKVTDESWDRALETAAMCVSKYSQDSKFGAERATDNHRPIETSVSVPISAERRAPSGVCDTAPKTAHSSSVQDGCHTNGLQESRAMTSVPIHNCEGGAA